MPLNVKDKETHELARRLAAATGETLTRAVKEALRERLDRVHRHRKAKATAEEILAIGRRCADRLKHPPVDHAELVYDERGLPR